MRFKYSFFLFFFLSFLLCLLSTLFPFKKNDLSKQRLKSMIWIPEAFLRLKPLDICLGWNGCWSQLQVPRRTQRQTVTCPLPLVSFRAHLKLSPISKGSLLCPLQRRNETHRHLINICWFLFLVGGPNAEGKRSLEELPSSPRLSVDLSENRRGAECSQDQSSQGQWRTLAASAPHLGTTPFLHWAAHWLSPHQLPHPYFLSKCSRILGMSHLISFLILSNHLLAAWKHCKSVKQEDR